MAEKYKVTVKYNLNGKEMSEIFNGSSPDAVVATAKRHFDGILGEASYKWVLFAPYNGEEETEQHAHIGV